VIGRRVDVTFTDPWDFVSDVGDKPYLGVVREFEEANGRVLRLVIDLERPATFGGDMYGTVDVNPRHEDAPPTSELLTGSMLSANMSAFSVGGGEQSRALPLIGEVRFHPV
jgi:hypothetical protein